MDELMVIEASRYLRDGEVVVAGTGMPLITILFAKKTHAPNICAMVETGPIDPVILPSPISVSDPKIQYRAVRLGSLREVLGCALQRGIVDVAMLGGAQIDPYANINSTTIGDYFHPTVRLPGSGGANDLASHARRILIMTRHEKRRFTPKCDYITSPGYIDGPDGRAKVGLPVTKPDITVVTDLCVMSIDKEVGRLKVTKLMPGVSLEQVLGNTGFEPLVAERLEDVTPPTAEQLRILREEVDPKRAYFR
jgi:glutaconate CoA-transferase subunit B